MERLRILDGETWQEATQGPLSYLMLGKSDCNACNEWTDELRRHLIDESVLPDVTFGKLLLDKPGLGSFKKASPWLKDVDGLPFNVIYRDGEVVKTWVGGGFERLKNRLERLQAEDGR